MIPRIGGWYRGWNMVGIGIIAQMLVVGSTTYAFGIYVTPVADDLGLSRTAVNQGLVFMHLGNALMAPFVGTLLDRVSLRRMMLISGFLLSGSMILISVGDALWSKGLLMAIPIPFAFQAGGTLCCYVLVARWFRLHRGRAMALVALGQSAGTVAIAPVIAALVSSYGWRSALQIEGVVIFVIMFTLSRLMGDSPGLDEREPGGESLSQQAAPQQGQAETKKVSPPRVMDILTMPIFWVLMAPVAITIGCIQLVIATLVPLAGGRGIELVQASTLMSILGISAIGSKLTLAWIADRVDREWLLIGCIVAVLFFCMTLTMELDYLMMALSCMVAGIALGPFFPVYSAVLADRFGAHALGTAEGLVAPAIAGSSALALYLSSRSYDMTGDYNQTFLWASASLGVAVLLAMIIRRVPPAEDAPS